MFVKQLPQMSPQSPCDIEPGSHSVFIRCNANWCWLNTSLHKREHLSIHAGSAYDTHHTGVSRPWHRSAASEYCLHGKSGLQARFEEDSPACTECRIQPQAFRCCHYAHPRAPNNSSHLQLGENGLHWSQEPRSSAHNMERKRIRIVCKKSTFVEIGDKTRGMINQIATIEAPTFMILRCLH
ncbi:hypothetical protein V5799_000732 [Amblyomma americanum]|uniref:Uncharacterized protein n=1 Tax=Amblyomma americanum TaxID=6943 RepID=A0AAQ4D274_AMBAM